MTECAPVTVLAVDGPSGSGKGTISRLLANALGWHLLDSGALYRLVVISGRQAGLQSSDVERHAALAAVMNVLFAVGAQGEERIVLNGLEVTDQVREEATGQEASLMAAWPSVRSALMDRQRAFAQNPGLVADGRDMGTVVFPQAPLKIFLTATPDERAKRRYNQLKDKDSAVNLAHLSREITERDLRDYSRSVSPLITAEDAIVIDSTGLSVAFIVEKVLGIGRDRALWKI